VQGDANSTLFVVRSGELKVFVATTEDDSEDKLPSWVDVARAAVVHFKDSSNKHKDLTQTVRLTLRPELAAVPGPSKAVLPHMCRSASFAEASWARMPNACSMLKFKKKPNHLQDLIEESSNNSSILFDSRAIRTPDLLQRRWRWAIKTVIEINKIRRKILAMDEAETLDKRIHAGEFDLSELGVEVARITEGMAFGEQSFLAGGGTPSMATVRTISYCQLLTLAPEDLTVVMGMYPSVSKVLEQYREEKLAEYEEKNHQRCNTIPRRISAPRISMFAQHRKASAVATAPADEGSESSNRRSSNRDSDPAKDQRCSVPKGNLLSRQKVLGKQGSDGSVSA